VAEITQDQPTESRSERPLNVSWAGLSQLLCKYPETAAEVEATIEALNKLYPDAPPYMRYQDCAFPRKRPYTVLRSHMLSDTENLRMAKENIEIAGNKLPPTEEKALESVLQYWFGWAATSKRHHNDAWMQ
jgi:hypothetical protein